MLVTPHPLLIAKNHAICLVTFSEFDENADNHIGWIEIKLSQEVSFESNYSDSLEVLGTPVIQALINKLIVTLKDNDKFLGKEIDD